MKFYKVGTEVKIITGYIDGDTDRTVVKHGIVTAVTSQTRLTARIGRTTGYQLNKVGDNLFANRQVAAIARRTVSPSMTAVGDVT